MARSSTVLLLIAAATCILALVNGQATCPTVAGYAFYRMQDAAGSLTLATLNAAAAATPAAVAAACETTPRCNAFTAAGELRIVPMEPLFQVLDASAADAQACDGIYVSSRTMSGLVLPANTNAATMGRDGAARLVDMMAEAAAAKRVAAKLRERGVEPKNAAGLARAELAKAFKDANTPQSQSSTTGGSYSLAGVVAALSYPVWDSRQANGTTLNYITPVKDQKQCGSCVAFAATAAAEAAVGAGKKDLSNSLDLSEQWLFFCNTLGSPSCGGGWYASAATQIIVQSNMPYEVNYPYKAAPNCTLDAAPVTRAGGNFSRLTFTDIALAKQHIRDWGIVLTYFAVYNDFYNWRATSAPYKWDGVSSLAGYHQVAVVGYNDTGSFWIVKNSWGTWWGDAGYIRMSYSAGVGLMGCTSDNCMGLRWGAPIDPKPAAVCNNTICEAGETCSSCEADCGKCATCGDGVCNGGETCSTCLTDCGIVKPDGSKTCCGDKVCDAAGGESCSSCPTDCGACPTCNNNRICEYAAGERCTSGSTGCSDCGACASSFCGDGKCTSARKGYSEDCNVCAKDCGGCSDAQYCGDGICTAARGESANSCSRDCKSSKFNFKAVRGIAEATTTTTTAAATAAATPAGNGNGNSGNKGNGRAKASRRSLE